jgi:hypothetical protein
MIQIRDTKKVSSKAMAKRHGLLTGTVFLCPEARWIGLEPITSAVKEQFLFAVKIPGQDLF